MGILRYCHKADDLCPGTGAGEEAGGARDHKQQFLRQETDDGNDNFFCYNGDCQNTEIQSQIIIIWLVVLLPD